MPTTVTPTANSGCRIVANTTGPLGPYQQAGPEIAYSVATTQLAALQAANPSSTFTIVLTGRTLTP